MIFYATFIPGLQEITEKIIRERLKDVSIQVMLDGAVVFETSVTYDKLNFFCFNNIFALIDILEQKNSRQKTGAELLEFHMQKILSRSNIKENQFLVISQNSKKTKSFRLVCSVENKPVSINEKLRQNTEKFIASISSLKTDRSRPDTEFWFLYRSEGFSFFLKRLTNNRTGEKELHPGELSPQLAWILCFLAGLRHGETTADPFCGYGSIPLAACRSFPAGKLFATDIDPVCVKYTSSRPGLREKETCQIVQADFRSLPDVVKCKLDVIITDPPWGIFKAELSLQELYDDIIRISSAVLKDNGRAIILTAAVRELENAVEKNGVFKISSQTPILVSGKKAVIFRLEK